MSVPEGWRSLPMPTLDELALFLGGSGDSFTGDLLRLMRKADPGNQRRLQQAFPREMAALACWQAIDGVTFGELERALDERLWSRS